MECFYSELHQLKTRASDSPPDLMEYDTKSLFVENISTKKYILYELMKAQKNLFSSFFF